MFTKQLLFGLALGAACTGLAFLMFSGGSQVELPISSSDNLKLLAQVIPNEVVEEAVAEEVPTADSDIIEVRTAPSAKKVQVVDEEAEAEKVAEEEASVITFCSYDTDDKPAYEGILSEVAWMGSDDNANAEWVEMQNRTKGDLDVSGWQLIDKAQQIQAIIPAGVILPRSGFLLFEREPHLLRGTTVLYKGALSNTDEGLRLFDADCDLQDEVIAKSKWPAGTNSPKHTAERDKDLDWHTYYGDDEAGIFGTPGEKNSSGPPPEPEPEEEPEPEPEPQEQVQEEPEPEVVESEAVPVTAGQLIVSEVVAGTSASAGDEFIELYNTMNAEIDLTGFSIKKKVLTSGSESSLVTTVNFEGKKIGVGERFIIGHGAAYAGISQLTWPTSYSLAYSGNAVMLVNTQGEVIDEVGWGEDIKDKSYACSAVNACAVQKVPNPGE